ncbi:MAG TPA: hypothetical protein PK843_14025 [bacterium]|nr:hypothetical protein [bacterium]
MTVALFLFGLILLWGGSELVTRNITPQAKAFGVRDCGLRPGAAIDIHRDVQERESGWMVLSSALVFCFPWMVCWLVRP